MRETIVTKTGRVLVLPTPEEDAQIRAEVAADPDCPPPMSDADWARVKPLVRVGRPRNNPLAAPALQQAEFARLIGVSPRTVQGWEQGRHPSAAARALLKIAAYSPETVRKALAV